MITRALVDDRKWPVSFMSYLLCRNSEGGAIERRLLHRFYHPHRTDAFVRILRNPEVHPAKSYGIPLRRLAGGKTNRDNLEGHHTSIGVRSGMDAWTMKLLIHNVGGSIHAVFSFLNAPRGCFGFICLQSESYGFCSFWARRRIARVNSCVSLQLIGQIVMRSS